ncbi:hypothetical protein BJX76DRAFT_322123 [Aspergillus varians]
MLSSSLVPNSTGSILALGSWYYCFLHVIVSDETHPPGMRTRRPKTFIHPFPFPPLPTRYQSWGDIIGTTMAVT